MSIEAMKLALEALKRLKAYGNVFRFRQDEQNPYDQACEAIAILRTAIEQAERQQALDKKAENARELGLDYEPVPWIENMTIDSTNELSKPTTPVQEPVADSAFEKWWDEEGSAAPKHRLDCEEHCYQIAKIAWSNGAYKAQESYPPAAPVQEPYGWVSQHTVKGPYEWQFNKELSGVYRDNAISILPVYTTPQPQEFVCSTGLCHYTQPQREWVSLTLDEIWEICKKHDPLQITAYARAIEKALKEKNT